MTAYNDFPLKRSNEMSRDSFERFYLQRVALSEACGCAEAVIRLRDIDFPGFAKPIQRRIPTRGKRKFRNLFFG